MKKTALLPVVFVCLFVSGRGVGLLGMIEIIEKTPKFCEIKANERFVYIHDSTKHKGDGIACIVTRPLGEVNMGRLVLMVHGSLSHKNAIYQPLLAERLGELGYSTIRIDFRGLGDSEGVLKPAIGRTIADDVDDIKTIYRAVGDEPICSKLFGRTKLRFYSIVAHSRGTLAMLNFALQLENSYIPLLVNCSGRFDGNGLMKRASAMNPGWLEKGGFYANTLRYGRIQELWIPKTETLSVIQVDTKKYSSISRESRIVSVYGREDDVVPPVDAARSYASIFEGRHQLVYIQGAGHNFFGKTGDLNINNLPYKRGLVNYNVELVRYLYTIFAAAALEDQL